MRYPVPNDDKPRTIPVGYVGENEWTEASFDVSKWLAADASFVIHATFTAPGARVGYPLPVTIEDGLAVVKFNAAELQKAGVGKLQLVATAPSGKVAKSRIYSTACLASLDGSGEPPEEWRPFIDEVFAAAVRAETAATAAEATIDATVKKSEIGRDNTNAGSYSLIVGEVNNGDEAFKQSIIVGEANNATGEGNAVIGYLNNAKKILNSVIIGNKNEIGQNTGGKIVNTLIVGDRCECDAPSGNVGFVAFGLKHKMTSTGGFATGQINTVSGNHASAFGSRVIASGLASFAGGNGSSDAEKTVIASGPASFAFGQNVQSVGTLSATFGDDNKNNAAVSVVFGRHNISNTKAKLVTGYGNADEEDALFEIGNGITADGEPATDSNAVVATRQNAFSVMRDGSAVVKNALIIGEENTVNAPKSVIIGKGHNVATEYGAITLGKRNTITGTDGVALGNDHTVSGALGMAIGNANTASNAYANAIGTHATASGPAATAVGTNAESAGRASAAFGNFSKATSAAQFVVGYGNAPEEDDVFEVGNGLDANGQPNAGANTAPTTRQNALAVKRDGTVVAQRAFRIGDLEIDEDKLARLLALIS